MISMNRVELLGNIGSNIDYKNEKMSVAKFSLATNEKFKDSEHTEWHKVVTFGKLAQIIAERCFKGDKLFVVGKLRTNKWTGNDGVVKYTTEIIADEVVFLTPKNTGRPEEQDDETLCPPSDIDVSF